MNEQKLTSQWTESSSLSLAERIKIGEAFQRIRKDPDHFLSPIQVRNRSIKNLQQYGGCSEDAVERIESGENYTRQELVAGLFVLLGHDNIDALLEKVTKLPDLKTAQTRKHHREKVGLAVRRACTALEISERELIEKTGMNRREYHEVTTGKPYRHEILKDVLHALGCKTVSELSKIPEPSAEHVTKLQEEGVYLPENAVHNIMRLARETLRTRYPRISSSEHDNIGLLYERKTGSGQTTDILNDALKAHKAGKINLRNEVEQRRVADELVENTIQNKKSQLCALPTPQPAHVYREHVHRDRRESKRRVMLGQPGDEDNGYDDWVDRVNESSMGFQYP